jgi:hypothetical protein
VRQTIRKIPLAKHKGITPRALDDRVKAGVVPPPFYENGIPYWFVDEIEEAERKAAEKRRNQSV